MNKIRSGLLYFLLVFGTGFILGAFRVPFLVPRIGERWAELSEMPIMAIAIYLSAGFMLKRHPEICHHRQSIIVGLIALVLLICAELGLAVIIQNRTLEEYIGSRDKVSGSVYLVLLLVFALMPRLRLQTHE